MLLLMMLCRHVKIASIKITLRGRDWHPRWRTEKSAALLSGPEKRGEEPDMMGTQARGRLRYKLRLAGRYWQLYLLILPLLVYLFIFNYMPIYGVQVSFKDFRTNLGIWGSPWVGLKHFVRFLEYRGFTQLLLNTLSLSLYSILTFPCPILFALMLNELRSDKYRKVVQMVSYAPHFISTVVICAMIKLFCARGTGVINNLIAALGGTRTDFLSIPAMFPHIYVWSGVWQEMGWGAIIYLAALSGVSSEIIEASLIDGANRLQVIWHIKLPTILPTVVIMLIMRCGSVLSVGFEKVFLLQNSLNLEASQTISTYVYEIGLQGGQFSYSAAIGLFNNIVNIVIPLLVNRVCKSISEIGIW